jgi:hypothetical protein
MSESEDYCGDCWQRICAHEVIGAINMMEQGEQGEQASVSRGWSQWKAARFFIPVV